MPKGRSCKRYMSAYPDCRQTRPRLRIGTSHNTSITCKRIYAFSQKESPSEVWLSHSVVWMIASPLPSRYPSAAPSAAMATMAKRPTKTRFLDVWPMLVTKFLLALDQRLFCGTLRNTPTGEHQQSIGMGSRQVLIGDLADFGNHLAGYLPRFTRQDDAALVPIHFSRPSRGTGGGPCPLCFNGPGFSWEG